MKKFLLLVLLMILAAPASFAQAVDPVAKPSAALAVVKQEAAKPAQNQLANPAAIQKFLNGVVDMVTVADPAKGVLPQVVIIGTDGKAVTFHVATAAMIHDSEMTMVTLDKLVKGEKVQVKYLTLPNGDLEARSIKIVK